MSREEASGARWIRVKMLLFLAFLAVALSAIYLTDLRRYLSAPALRGYLAGLGAWAYAAYVVLYALLITVGFPGSILTITGAVLFGTLLNTGLTVIGATGGACGAFLVARFLARDWVAARLRGRAREVDERIAREGVIALFVLRLIPVVPFNVLNFGSGLTAIRFRDYTWATALGMIPGVFAYSYLTNQAVEIDLSRPSTLLDPGLLAAVALFLFLIVAVPLAWRRYERKRHRRGD